MKVVLAFDLLGEIGRSLTWLRIHANLGRGTEVLAPKDWYLVETPAVVAVTL